MKILQGDSRQIIEAITLPFTILFCVINLHENVHEEGSTLGKTAPAENPLLLLYCCVFLI